VNPATELKEIKEMKNWNTGIVMSAALVMALPAFASPKKAAVEKETKIAFSPAASVVGWEAKKVTGKHNGKIALKKRRNCDERERAGWRKLRNRYGNDRDRRLERRCNEYQALEASEV
jgi:hypothetical protein